MLDAISRRIALSSLAMISIGCADDAQFGGGDDNRKTAEQLVQVEMLADVAQIEPGQEFGLAFVFEIEPHWHIYWKNPGDSGMATEISVEAPAGFEVGDLVWARPGAFAEEIGVTYGYDDRVVLFVPVTAPQSLIEGTVSFQADLRWLVCKNLCLMGRTKSSIEIATVSRPEPQGTAVDVLIKEYLKRVPRPLADEQSGSIDFDGSTLTIAGPALGFDVAVLFPAASPGVTLGQPRFTFDGDRFRMAVEVETNPNNALGEPMRIVGVIGLGADRDDPAYEFDVPVNTP